MKGENYCGGYDTEGGAIVYLFPDVVEQSDVKVYQLIPWLDEIFCDERFGCIQGLDLTRCVKCIDKGAAFFDSFPSSPLQNFLFSDWSTAVSAEVAWRS